MGRRNDVDSSDIAPEESQEETGDRFLKMKGICHYLGISKSTFYRLLSDDTSGLGEIVVRLPCVDGPRALESRLKEWAEGGR